MFLEECPANEFKCNNGDCIDEEGRCDDMFQCKDDSDESDCLLTTDTGTA